MKKKSFKALTLNKKFISNLKVMKIKGGTDTLINFNCRVTNESFCECHSEPCNPGHTIDNCDVSATCGQTAYPIC